MRIHSLVVLAALAGCASNPDPRSPTIEQTQSTSFGGWIVVHTRHGDQSGELISVEPTVVNILNGTEFQTVRLDDIQTAELYEYDSDSGFGVWGILGTLSTISHGFILVLSAPVWIGTTTAVTALESRHMILNIPDDRWDQVAQWARFPQGLPPGVDRSVLVDHRRPQPAVAPNSDLAQRRADAWTLTKQAETAARTNDCATVIKLDETIKNLDPELWKTVFMGDIAIQQCLATAPN